MSNYKADVTKEVTITLTMPYAALVSLTRDVGRSLYDLTKKELKDGGKGIPFKNPEQFDGEQQQVLKDAVIAHIEAQQAEWNDDHYILFKQLTALVDVHSRAILEKAKPVKWANLYRNEDGKPYWGACLWDTEEEASRFSKDDPDYITTAIYKGAEQA